MAWLGLAAGGQVFAIFILSARPGEKDKSLAIEMGADLFLSKPYDLKDLVRRIRQRLSMQGRAAA